MTRAARDAAYEAWIEEARAVPLEEIARAAGTALRRSGAELVGPCPVCGGKDRFSIHVAKRVFYCRQGDRGGDGIALAQYIHACDFTLACEILTNRPPPGRDEAEKAPARAAREEVLAARAQERAAREERQREAQAWYREQERRRLHGIWSRAQTLPGSPAEAYLALRQVRAPAGAHLRYAPDHPLFADGGRKAEVVHRGPALLAAIVGPLGAFAGLHATWIDLAEPDGKARVPDPVTGEFVPAKKVRGSKQGGRIELVRMPAPCRLIVGEGIETVLSVWCALEDIASPLLDGAAFWSSVDLGNLGGRAADSVPHPTQRVPDRLGRERVPQVGGPEPDFASPAMPVPDSVEELILLGDGDSDPFATGMALRRAARRHERPGRGIREAWARPGFDFNDLRRGMAA